MTVRSTFDKFEIFEMLNWLLRYRFLRLISAVHSRNIFGGSVRFLSMPSFLTVYSIAAKAMWECSRRRSIRSNICGFLANTLD